MLNPEPSQDQFFYFACVRDTVDTELIRRWATDDDRAYAGRRPRSNPSLLALAALRALLFAVTRQSGWIVVRSSAGKPSVTTVDGQSGPSVSLSHTPGLIAVAVASGGLIGIDVERHCRRDFVALADHGFGPSEQQEVAVGGLDAFYRIWTLREATAKATGEGLALVLNRIDLADGIADDRPRWHLLHLLPELGYSLGLAWPADNCHAGPLQINLESSAGRV
jgi:4'-phosphopantetheinyl transferase